MCLASLVIRAKNSAPEWTGAASSTQIHGIQTLSVNLFVHEFEAPCQTGHALQVVVVGKDKAQTVKKDTLRKTYLRRPCKEYVRIPQLARHVGMDVVHVVYKTGDCVDSCFEARP